MPKINNINNFIIPAQDSNCYDLYYSEIIGGVSGCVANVNGVTVNVAPQSNLFITINSFSDGTGCFLGGYQPDKLTKSFVSVWDTSRTSTGSSTAAQVKLPLVSTGTYNFIIDWGDGKTDKITTWNQAQTTHSYSSVGVYRIKITGTCYGWRFNNTGDRLKILSIENWGIGFRLGNLENYFQGCSNLEITQVEDVLDLTNTTSLVSAFNTCGRLTTINRMNEWNMTNVTTTSFMFFNCRLFNSYINDWDTSNITTMSYMLQLKMLQVLETSINLLVIGIHQKLLLCNPCFKIKDYLIKI
jgi:surface protein